MTIFKARRQTIGIYPTRRGFGFAVLETRGRLAHAGLARLGRNDEEEFLARLRRMIERYNPSLMIFEDTIHTTRGEKAMRRIELAVDHVRRSEIGVLLVSRAELREALDIPTSATNYAVAEKVAELLPELKRSLPDKPKIWQSKDERMALFAAAALAVCVYTGTEMLKLFNV